ncbi:MAG: DMT family transporter [Rhodospirillaceae bacterium]|nr:DMT family transporter [Rhodospirillaceae bacterium]MBT5245049.1 DMT family transporter [Rhodospirillaceae bacterium]MBT6242777.1 DMT family transporter [Rhodospirillaceae bacterium]
MMSGAGMILLSPDGLLLRLVGDASTWTVLFYRTAFTALTMAIILMIRERQDFSAIWRGFGRAGWISTFLMAASSLSFVGAISNTSVANTLVLVATMPFFSAVLGWILIGETVKPRTWISILLALGGIGIIFSGSFGGGNLSGDLMAIGTAFLQGLNLIVIRKAKDRSVTMPALCLSGILAALVVLPLSQPMTVSTPDFMLLMLMGLFVVPVSLVLFLSGARYAPAAEIALLSLVETVLGPFWAWLGVGEEPTINAIIGGAVVIVAVAMNALIGMRNSHRAG